MIKVIQPSIIGGIITAPASKSMMQRACAAALLRQGESIILNAGNCNDDKAAISIIKALGATVEANGERKLLIRSNGVHPVNDKINCGESGLCLRMFTPIAALSIDEIKIEGEGTLTTRPINFFKEVLPQLGVKVSDSKLPVKIQGPLMFKNISVDGSLSSQFISGLLMAYADGNANDVTIYVSNLTSKPYIDLTLEVMNDFGLHIPVNNNYESFTFPPFNSLTNKLVSYTVEGDWSGASFLLVAGAVAGNVIVKGLKQNSLQGDKKILEALQNAGANILISDEQIKVNKSSLNAIEFDATDCPDLFPPLIALAANCNGVSKIRGVHRLKYKESDRAFALQTEFAKLNITIAIEGDIMIINGGTLKVIDANCSSHNDHRIAMALAIAALNCDIEIMINEAESVNKSYPDFWNDLKSLAVTFKD